MRFIALSNVIAKIKLIIFVFPSFSRRYFATVFAISYAIFLVIFGAVVFISDVVVSQYPLPQVKLNLFQAIIKFILEI